MPEKLRGRVREDLHADHPGIVRMKAIARSYVWGPKLDDDLEKHIHNCMDCQAVKNSPAAAPLHPWLWPAKLWQRVHLDFAGPFLDRMFLVIIDAHSKWPEVVEIKSTTAHKTITELRKLFSCYGLPLQVVTDNGPQFIAHKFDTFMKQNGIKHIHVAPYHPSSNGLAESFVQILKKALKASANSGQDVSFRLANFLLTY